MPLSDCNRGCRRLPYKHEHSTRVAQTHPAQCALKNMLYGTPRKTRPQDGPPRASGRTGSRAADTDMEQSRATRAPTLPDRPVPVGPISGRVLRHRARRRSRDHGNLTWECAPGRTSLTMRNCDLRSTFNICRGAVAQIHRHLRLPPALIPSDRTRECRPRCRNTCKVGTCRTSRS